MSIASEQPTVGASVETLLAEIAQAPTVTRARERSEELARTLVELYGTTLERVLEIVHANADARTGEAIFNALCADRLVESMLVLHGLHPLGVEDRVRAALDAVRPYLESHAGGIEVVAVQDGVAHLRLEGTCDGCSSSAATVELTVKRAILERLPDIHDVRVENVTPTRGATPVPTLRVESEWIDLDALLVRSDRTLTRLVAAQTPIVLVRDGESVLAYRDRCPACSREFEAPTYTHPMLMCTGCGCSYDLARGGRATAAEGLPAEPFPLERDGGRVRVAIPVGA